MNTKKNISWFIDIMNYSIATLKHGEAMYEATERYLRGVHPVANVNIIVGNHDRYYQWSVFLFCLSLKWISLVVYCNVHPKHLAKSILDVLQYIYALRNKTHTEYWPRTSI